MTNSTSSVSLGERISVNTSKQQVKEKASVLQQNLSVRSFYHGKNVFITGATGFLGKFLVEKLLYATDINELYVLLRSKRGKTPEARLKEFKEDAIFSFRLKDNQLNKLRVVSGDISLPDLGLSVVDRQTLKSKVNIIFHSAASVRFDDPMPQGVRLNVIATLEMLKLAESMDDLQSFVHVSTAFVNCHDNRLDEKPVDCVYDPYEVINNPSSIKNLDPYPNTYTLTKSLAEKLVMQYSANSNLPIAIARPAIVMGAVDEPIRGFNDNFKQAPSALISLRVSGLLRVIPAAGHNNSPIIPVDYCVNGLVVIGAQCAHDFTTEQKSGAIYALVNAGENQISITAGFNHPCLKPMEAVYPFKLGIRFPDNLDFEPNPVKFHLKSLFYDRLFGLLFDFVLLVTLQRTGVTRIQKKALEQLHIFKFFMSRAYHMADDRMHQVWSNVEVNERKLFNVDCKCIDWKSYIENYWPAMRKYAFGHRPEDDDYARRRIRRASMIMYSVYSFIIVIVLAIFFR